jgi:SAM-dependent methyltransferase
VQNIREAIAKNRLFNMLLSKLKSDAHFNQELFDRMADYTDKYLEATGVTAKETLQHYSDFIQTYHKDAKEFAASGKFPLEVDEDREPLERKAYDSVLLMSTLLTTHRFNIMDLVASESNAAEKALFIGCGPGLEIQLVKWQFAGIVAHDLDLGEQLPELHPGVEFRKEFFDGTSDEKFDTIFLIEILEHLEHPLLLLENCRRALRANGTILLTTATNIPQFDHLYNFESDHVDFERQITAMGFEIQVMFDLPHTGVTLDIGAKNRFYVLK